MWGLMSEVYLGALVLAVLRRNWYWEGELLRANRLVFGACFSEQVALVLGVVLKEGCVDVQDVGSHMLACSAFALPLLPILRTRSEEAGQSDTSEHDACPTPCTPTRRCFFLLLMHRRQRG